MKKVLFVATVTGHINAFHIPYLKWFKEEGYEVHVASKGNEKIEYCDKHYDLPFERFPIKKNNYKVYKELKKIINKNKYEVIHCHTPVGGILTRLAAKDARKNGTRVIYTAHGFHFYKGAPIINWMIYYPIEKLMAKYTDCLITINEEDYNLAKNKFKAKQIKLVRGVGVDETRFNFIMSDTKKIELRNNLDINPNDFVIIYPAELSKRKNQEMLLQAISILKQKRYENLKILLPGRDSMNGLYQKMTKDLKIENEIKFLGYRKDIPQLMRISNLAVSTSVQEGLPVNLIEAMMSGLPIIATNCRGNRDLVPDCIPIDDYQLLAEKIEKEIKDHKSKNKYNINDYKLMNVLEEMKNIYSAYI